MAYERTKMIDGRAYRYLVKCIWIDGVPRQKILKYLGPAEPVYKTEFARNTNASIFVRKLTDKEKNTLKTAVHSSSAFIKDRAKIILLSSEGLFARQIAEKLNCDARKPRMAVMAFNSDGIISLQRKKAKGAVPKFTKEDTMVILIHFSKSPRDFSIPISAWTLPKFRDHLVKSGVVRSISVEKVRQILLHAGAKLNRSKRWQYSPDKNFLKKKE